MRVRDAKKLASRARVLDAAKSLFEEIGFEDTTVRMIAQKAGLSPGGVFTTFTDKVAILSHILIERRQTLFDRMEAELARQKGSVRERIGTIMAMAHADDYARLGLMAAYHGASFTWSHSIEQEHRRSYARLITLIRDILVEGVEAGEISADIDLSSIGFMLTSLYNGASRAAIFDSLSEEQLHKRMSGQLDLLFMGLAPRPAAAISSAT